MNAGKDIESTRDEDEELTQLITNLYDTHKVFVNCSFKRLKTKTFNNCEFESCAFYNVGQSTFSNCTFKNCKFYEGFEGKFANSNILNLYGKLIEHNNIQ